MQLVRLVVAVVQLVRLVVVVVVVVVAAVAVVLWLQRWLLLVPLVTWPRELTSTLAGFKSRCT